MDDIQKNPLPYSQLFQTIRKRIRPYRGRFWLASFLRLTSDTMYLYTTYALAQSITTIASYTPGQSLSRFWFFLTAWTLTYIYTVTARQTAKYYCYQVAEQINLDAQVQTIGHLAQVDIAWHEKENTGNKLKRMQNGGEGLEKLLRIWIDTYIEAGVNFVGMIIILTHTDITVGFLLVVFLCTYILIALPLNRRASLASRAVNQLEEDFSGLAFETVNNIRSVKVMGMFSRLATLLETQSDLIVAAVRKRIQRFRFKSAVQTYWQLGFRVLIMTIIAYGISQGRYEVGFLLLFNFYFSTLRLSVEEISSVSQDITIARFHLARMDAILQEPLRIDDDTKKIHFPHDWKIISIQDVSFAYDEHVVLNHISFDIHRGEKIGVVGLSGSGKTTLFKLLLKEYENFTGDIFFDDISIRDIQKSSYVERVAVVLQETEVFHFSLKDNIAIANQHCPNPETQLDVSLTTAHITDFLPRLPQGIDTLIGEKGVKLSGGEKQRVGIARAIYKQPDILFLDEATSHLDLESEEKIKDSLHQFFQQVTAIVIAHRLTTIQEMDRILVIQDGQLLESGNFKTLYKKQGRFFELWEKQRL